MPKRNTLPPRARPPTCRVCEGIGWVCENHPNNPWREEKGCRDCGGAGVKCVCNPEAHMPPGVKVYAAVPGTNVDEWVQ